MKVATALLSLLAFLLLAPLSAPAQSKLRAQIYELRTYTTNPGLLPNLHERFREHTNRLFVKHGMHLIGYWTPADEDDKLIYILAFDSPEAREKAWKAFLEDPEWKEVEEASEEKAGGPIVSKIDSVLMFPTDYSPIR